MAVNSLIKREISHYLDGYFDVKIKRGLILSGVVGCGKTTVIQEFLKKRPAGEFILNLTCDDTKFRSEVALDSKYIFNLIRSNTSKSAFLFVDEVQKSEHVFDAIKYAFDHLDINFIISGSNPDYLNTIAKKRLQRRAEFVIMMPFSLSEILSHEKLLHEEVVLAFRKLVLEQHIPEKIPALTLSEDIQKKCDLFLNYGGTPRAYQFEDAFQKLIEIKQIVERGFESLSYENSNYLDQITIELAKLHAKEFTYNGIFQKTGLRRRDAINHKIDLRLNHGYVLKKKPKILSEDRSSYISSYSFIDPGFVTYLTGEVADEVSKGFRVEGLVFSRLRAIQQFLPTKSEISYYKPYTIDSSSKLKFLQGEVDFVFTVGKINIPIEVKSGLNFSSINLSLIKDLIKKTKAPFAIVLYLGAPFYDKKEKIIYWPYWAI